ncbi:hypothetical protein A1Q2_03999 [Trichosporon asahii var. asahii CBS 8904]|uniref:Uncharacterized protein n=1 Tax=Trichosporon asahii var. asahii (strain CBS 8904) TaxID=1220162 RepID=K1VY56_TRIAC|nr:hypothetical protein A1Q2_03999 [Trichosporon asahii var. asahii CBS 8904]
MLTDTKVRADPSLRRSCAPSRGGRPANPSLLDPRGPGRLRRRDVRAPRQRGRDADAEAAHGAAAAQLVRAIGQSLPLPRRRKYARRLRAHAEARAKQSDQAGRELLRAQVPATAYGQPVIPPPS